MWVLMVEAGVAFFLLVFIVWWTMYQGPKHPNNEKRKPPAQDKPLEGDSAPPKD